VSVDALVVPDFTTLECEICGDVAIRSDNGRFMEDSGDACISCGHPGHVGINEDITYDGDDETEGLYAYWSADEKCGPTCHEQHDAAWMGLTPVAASASEPGT
jgi:hypothetical protein